MRTQQKCVVTDTWRSLGCRTTPLEHWTRRKPTVEPRWAKQQTKQRTYKSRFITEMKQGPSQLRVDLYDLVIFDNFWPSTGEKTEMNFDRILVIVARYVRTVSLNIIIMTIPCSTKINADSVKMIKLNILDLLPPNEIVLQ